jgi:hypothetical protein
MAVKSEGSTNIIRCSMSVLLFPEQVDVLHVAEANDRADAENIFFFQNNISMFAEIWPI